MRGAEVTTRLTHSAPRSSQHRPLIYPYFGSLLATFSLPSKLVRRNRFARSRNSINGFDARHLNYEPRKTFFFLTPATNARFHGARRTSGWKNGRQG